MAIPAEMQLTGLDELRRKLQRVQGELRGTLAADGFARWINRCYRLGLQRRRAEYMLEKLFGGGRN